MQIADAAKPAKAQRSAISPIFGLNNRCIEVISAFKEVIAVTPVLPVTSTTCCIPEKCGFEIGGFEKNQFLKKDFLPKTTGLWD